MQSNDYKTFEEEEPEENQLLSAYHEKYQQVTRAVIKKYKPTSILEIDDYLHSLLLKLVEKHNKLRKLSSIEQISYVSRMAKNLMIDEHRKIKRRRKFESREMTKNFVTSYNPYTYRDLKLDIELCLDALTKKQLEVIELRKQGYSLVQISKRLGENYEAIKSRYKHAKAKMKKLY